MVTSASVGSPNGADSSPDWVGHGARWTLESFHQLHDSSAANGSTGARSL